MRCVLREKLMAHALRLSEVGGCYRTESHRFAVAYFGWLEAAEKDLSGLRAPLAILLQAERTALTAVADGYTPQHVERSRNAGKVLRFAAAQSLEKVSLAMRAQIEDIDRELNEQNERMCHTFAAVASKSPGVFADLRADQTGIDTIWQLIGATPETAAMHQYFCARLAVSDRNYILSDILQKAVANRS